MTLKEMMTGNIQAGQAASIMQLGAQSPQRSNNSGNTGDSAFGEILGSKLGSSDKQIGVRRSEPDQAYGRRSSETSDLSRESRPRFVTYKEASESVSKDASSEPAVRQRVKTVEDSVGKPDEPDNDDVRGKTADKNPDNNILALAQVLQLDLRELQKVLKEAGITTESLSDINEAAGNASKLSELLGLNEEQKGTLEKLLRLACEAVNASKTASTGSDISKMTGAQTKAADTAGNAGNNAEVISADLVKAAEGQTAQQEQGTLFQELGAKIKVQLDTLGSRLKNDQSTVETELRQLMQQLSDKVSAKIQGAQDPADTASMTETVQEDIQATAAADNANAQNSDTGRETAAKPEKEPAVLQPVTAVKDSQPQTVFPVAQADSALKTEVAEKAAVVRTPVEAKEIINQVLEKAKVILTPDKSEMVMDLKPDSLGKISLKVITENGMVMAKFVAESQQVKQVLEANMQLLKDSLEKQGMNVQGFSVSVRQDSNRSAEKWQQQEGSRSGRTIGPNYRTAGIEGSLTGPFEASARSNPYEWGGSTINLTA